MSQTKLENGECLRLASRYRSLVRGIAALVITVGCLVLIGWFFQIELLVRGLPGYTYMRFNTAVCLVLAGLGLWLEVDDADGWQKKFGRLCGLVLFTVALLTLAEQVFGWNLLIDELLWKNTWSDTQGRMALVTSICFFFAGISLNLFRASRAGFVWIAQISAVFCNLAAQWALLDLIFRSDKGAGVAVHTAVALFLLSLGMMLIPNPKGFLSILTSMNSSGRLMRRLLPAATIVPLLVGWLRWAGGQAGWLSEKSGIAIMVVAYSATLLGVAVWTATSGDSIERERIRMEQEVSQFFSLPMHSLLAVIGIDGCFKRLSPSWTGVLGYSEAELLGKRFMDFVAPEDHAATAACAADIIAGSPAVAFENRYLTKSGGLRVLSWNAMISDSGLMYCIAQDITEKKLAEEQLRQSEENMRLLVETIHDHALYLLDVEGRIVSWNLGAQKLTGYSGEELIGRSLTVLDVYGHERNKDFVKHLLATAIDKGHVEDHGWRMHKDGSRFQVDGYINALWTPEGKLRGFAKIVRDVTERVSAENKIRELNEHLEQRVLDRTAELGAVNKELEAFAYSVSHDLRAPLRHLDGFLTLLSKRSYSTLDVTSQHYIDNTLDASRRLGVLIDDLLQFSRLGRSAMHKKAVDLNMVVAEVRRVLEPGTIGRTIHWQVADLPVVIADQSMLRQVIENLLGNALKFTRTRAVAEITVGSKQGPNSEIVIFVKDNGVGFDMQYYDKLFQVFQRLHSEEEFDGTGIGLANVRRVMERHDGRAWAEGVSGLGAAFYISLPANCGDNGEQNEQTETHLVSRG